MRAQNYVTRKVNRIPPEDELLPQTLYICEECEVAVHLCMCGCKEKVVTPLQEGQWVYEFNPTTNQASLHPSIGNYQYNCKSHYFLKDGRVIWC